MGSFYALSKEAVHFILAYITLGIIIIWSYSSARQARKCGLTVAHGEEENSLVISFYLLSQMSFARKWTWKVIRHSGKNVCISRGLDGLFYGH